MENNILYFPYINLPNNRWSIKSILYWDTVGTIVPSDYLHNPKGLTDFMKEAVQTGHIIQHFTSDYENIQQEVDQKILGIIENFSFAILESQNNFAKGLTSRIHSQKFSWQFFKELERLKVAKREGRWYQVENKIAAMMMTSLATSLARELDHIASTDSPVYIQEGNLVGLTKNNPNRIRSYILNEIMPYPREVELSKLIKFKEKYYDQLNRFRLLVDETVWTLNGITDEKNRKNLLNTKMEQIIDRKDQLVARLNENKLGSIALGGVKGMLVDAGIALVTGDVVKPVATVLGTINQIIKEYNGNPIKNEELAYLALMEHRLR